MARQKSEFGKGLVINLVKFSEHFFNDQAHRIGTIHQFSDHLDDEAYLNKYGVDVKNTVGYFKVFNRGSYDETLSHMITLWANGATDHLYEIKTIGNKTIDPLIKQLREKGLAMGHGFGSIVYTYKDMQELMTLTKKITVLVDKKLLGIKDAEWGIW